MKNTVTPYNRLEESKKIQVEEMFDNIAGKYDFLNRVLSLGIDKIWRKKAINYIASFNPKLILDIASGTGDFAFEALRITPDKIVAFDLSALMLKKGIEKAAELDKENIIEWIKGDSEKLPFDDEYFNAITVGFGVRNFENLEIGLNEIYRVLKTGGSGVILEISQPHNPITKVFYNLYFTGILPIIGKLFSKDPRAYTYLPESVKAFPQGKDFEVLLSKIGFKFVKWEPLTFGTCAMYTFRK